jgi:small subunit ribosomal protein S16
VAVKLRLKRQGRRNRSFYRITVVDSRHTRDGAVLEELGWYDPNAKEADKQLSLNLERAEHWLKAGAQPTQTVGSLIRRRKASAGPQA